MSFMVCFFSVTVSTLEPHINKICQVLFIVCRRIARRLPISRLGYILI